MTVPETGRASHSQGARRDTPTQLRIDIRKQEERAQRRGGREAREEWTATLGARPLVPCPAGSQPPPGGCVLGAWAGQEEARGAGDAHAALGLSQAA